MRKLALRDPNPRPHLLNSFVGAIVESELRPIGMQLETVCKVVNGSRSVFSPVSYLDINSQY